MNQNQLRLTASILADGFLRLAAGEPYGYIHRIAEQHLSGRDLDIVKHHVTQAGYANARGDHTAAEMHLRDARRHANAVLGRPHPVGTHGDASPGAHLDTALSETIAHHAAAAHAEMHGAATPHAPGAPYRPAVPASSAGAIGHASPYRPPTVSRPTGLHRPGTPVRTPPQPGSPQDLIRRPGSGGYHPYGNPNATGQR